MPTSAPDFVTVPELRIAYGLTDGDVLGLISRRLLLAEYRRGQRPAYLIPRSSVEAADALLRELGQRRALRTLRVPSLRTPEPAA